jgi:hypothetical protein
LNSPIRISGELTNARVCGSQLALFLSQTFERFTVAAGMWQGNVENRLGAACAGYRTLSEGLHVIGQSTLSTLTYTEWAKFLGFPEQKTLPTSRRSTTRVARPKGSVEGYWRFPKRSSVLATVSAAIFKHLILNSSRSITARTDDLSNGLRVQLYYLDDGTMRRLNCSKKAPDGHS